MSLVADTGGLYARYDSDDAHHATASSIVQNETGPIIVPMAILGELDYLLRALRSVDAELDFLDGVISGAFTLEPLTATDNLRCRELIATYRDRDLGLVDLKPALQGSAGVHECQRVPTAVVGECPRDWGEWGERASLCFLGKGGFAGSVNDGCPQLFTRRWSREPEPHQLLVAASAPSRGHDESGPRSHHSAHFTPPRQRNGRGLARRRGAPGAHSLLRASDG